MPLRVGVDLVEVATFRSRFEGRAELLASTFTEAELRYCLAQRPPWPHLAARLAAREAAVKALGTGLAGEIGWSDIEVTRDPAGAPGLRVRGAFQDALARARLSAGPVSLAHTDTHAIAVVLLGDA